MNTAAKIVVSIGSVAIIATAGIAGLVLATSNDKTTTSQIATTSTSSASAGTTTTPSMMSPMMLGYKDGTYTASTNYHVPHGWSNTMSATVTVSNGKITAVKTNDSYTDGESAMYVDSFDSSVSGRAVGTSLADASFSRIGGASLTTSAFDSVLDTIRTQAAA